MNIGKEQLALLKEFVALCKTRPQVLNNPELQFFKHWLESLGATVPSGDEHSHAQPKPESKAEVPDLSSSSSEEEPEVAESDLEIDREGVITDSEVANQEMGDESAEVTEEMMDQGDAKRSEAMQLFGEGKFEEAIAALTEGIKINPTSAPMFAKRASCYLKLKRPNAAIKDCDRAVQLNPDQAQAYKWRGLAHKLLGDWEAAFTDLSTSNKIDYSDDACAAMKEVETKAKRVKEHHRKYQRLQEEKELKKRQRRAKKARAAYDRQKKQSQSSNSDFEHGMPHGQGMPTLDPELMSMMQDPEVMAAFEEIMSDPSKMAKYASNPKIRKAMEKMQSGAFKGGFPGAAGEDMDFETAGASPQHQAGRAPPSADDLD